MIFFGHGNYNKQNSVYRSDICQGCGKLAQLHSYTTTPAAHLYWIPIIPTGKKRIINQCPHCKVGREMKLKEWNKLRNEEVLASLEKLRTNPGDRDQALTTLDLTSAFGTPEEFTEVVQLVHPHFGQDPDVLVKMGWGMNRFQHPEEAQQLLNQSLTLKEDPEVRELMEFHRDAPRAPEPRTPNRFFQLLPFLIVPGIILFFVVSILIAGFASKPSYVFLVNGLPEPYSVLINGEEVAAPANSQKKLEVDYGEVTVGPSPGRKYPFEFSVLREDLSADFSERVSGGKTVVFNPDKTALIAWEEVVYFPDDIEVATDEMMEAGEYQFHAGRPMHEFPKVDYPFSAPPQNVEMSGSRLVKTRLELFPQLSPQERVMTLLNEGDPGDALNLVKAQLTANPTREAGAILPLLSLNGDYDSAIQFIEKRLDERPVLVEWHRHYQSLKMGVDPDADLLGEYEDRRSREPDNADLVYLHARLLPDGPGQNEAFEQATRLVPPSAYGFHALAYDAWVHGKFTEALELQRKALDLKPEVTSFLEREMEYLKASERNEELLAKAKATYESSSPDLGNAETLVTVLGRLGKKAEADAVISETLNSAGGNFQLPPDVRQTYETYLNASFAAGARQREEFIRFSRAVQKPWWNFNAAMAENDVRGASEYLQSILAEQGEMDDVDILLLYAAASTAGEGEVAAEQLASFLAKNEASGSAVTSWFAERAEMPDLQQLIETNLEAGIRSAVAVALVARYPEDPDLESFRTYAKTMNYHVGYPYFVVDSLTGD